MKIAVELTDEQAWEYAQYLKRVSWGEYRENAENDEQAYLMRDAGEAIRTALAEQGFAPR